MRNKGNYGASSTSSAASAASAASSAAAAKRKRPLKRKTATPSAAAVAAARKSAAASRKEKKLRDTQKQRMRERKCRTLVKEKLVELGTMLDVKNITAQRTREMEILQTAVGAVRDKAEEVRRLEQELRAKCEKKYRAMLRRQSELFAQMQWHEQFGDGEEGAAAPKVAYTKLRLHMAIAEKELGPARVQELRDEYAASVTAQQQLQRPSVKRQRTMPMQMEVIEVDTDDAMARRSARFSMHDSSSVSFVTSSSVSSSARPSPTTRAVRPYSLPTAGMNESLASLFDVSASSDWLRQHSVIMIDYRSVFHHVSDILRVFDANDMRVIDCNQVALGVERLPRSKFVGRMYLQTLEREDRELVRRKVRNIVTNGCWDWSVVKRIRPDKSVKYIRSVGWVVPHEDGVTPRYIVSVSHCIDREVYELGKLICNLNLDPGVTYARFTESLPADSAHAPAAHHPIIDSVRQQSTTLYSSAASVSPSSSSSSSVATSPFLQDPPFAPSPTRQEQQPQQQAAAPAPVDFSAHNNDNNSSDVNSNSNNSPTLTSTLLESPPLLPMDSSSVWSTSDVFLDSVTNDLLQSSPQMMPASARMSPVESSSILMSDDDKLWFNSNEE